MELTRQDLDMLITSMEYTKRAFEEYRDYPNNEFKRQRINEAQCLLTKLRAMRKGASSGQPTTDRN